MRREPRLAAFGVLGDFSSRGNKPRGILPHMLTAGDKAPTAVKVLDSDGKSVSLAGLLGKRAVVYFYPKDNTPGCTKEACSIRDWRNELTKIGVEVIGVSKDAPRSHQGFTEKYKLNFSLWSDPNHKLMEAFGTWQKKKFMGREYMGTTRSTFAIDPKGKILYVWEKVTPDGHGEEIYTFFKQNKAKGN